MSPPVPLSHAARIVSAISDFPNPNNEDAILAFMYPGHTFNLGESSSETLKQGFLSLYRSIYKAFDNEVSGFEAQITEAKDDLKLANGTIENLRRQVKDFTPKLVDAKEQLRRANGQIESLQDTIKDLAPKRKREDEEADEEDIDSSHGQKSRKIVSDDRVPMKPPRRTERAVSKSPEEILVGF